MRCSSGRCDLGLPCRRACLGVDGRDAALERLFEPVDPAGQLGPSHLIFVALCAAPAMASP